MKGKRGRGNLVLDNQHVVGVLAEASVNVDVNEVLDALELFDQGGEKETDWGGVRAEQAGRTKERISTVVAGLLATVEEAALIDVLTRGYALLDALVAVGREEIDHAPVAIEGPGEGLLDEVSAAYPQQEREGLRDRTFCT